MSSIIADLASRIVELERRMAGMMLHGSVAEVDPAKGTVRLRMGGADAEPFLSPAVPYTQVAGALKAHVPPTVGMQMTMLSPGGDFRQAVAVPMTWSDQNPSPSEDGTANVVTFGSTRIELTNGGLKITVGGTVVDITGQGVAITGKTTIDGDTAIEGSFGVTGGSFTHNAVDVGSSHEHTGVTPGGSLTGPPAG